MKDKARKAVHDFRKKYGVCTVSENSLVNILDKQGYTVVYYNIGANSESVSLVISNLGLYEEVKALKGFTYASDKFRLVFVNKSLSEDERLLILAHETGHIFFGHMAKNSIIGEDVREENEANEFAHYLLHPTLCEKYLYKGSKQRKIITAVTAVLLVAAVGICAFVIINNRLNKNAYYVTLTGTKYHTRDCRYVKYRDDIRLVSEEEIEKGIYKPCAVCINGD